MSKKNSEKKCDAVEHADGEPVVATAPKRKYTHFEKQVLSAENALKLGALGAVNWLRARGRNCFDLSATGRAYGGDLPAFKAALDKAKADAVERTGSVGATVQDALEEATLDVWSEAVTAVQERIDQGGRAGEKRAKDLWKSLNLQAPRKPRAKKVKAVVPVEIEAPTSDDAETAPSEDAAAAA